MMCLAVILRFAFTFSQFGLRHKASRQWVSCDYKSSYSFSQIIVLPLQVLLSISEDVHDVKM